MSDKKRDQLGMNPSTASNRLVKDLLFKYATAAGHKCHQCGEELTRETFSIEHILPWLDSDDPTSLFFDLDNIAYSHLKCNSGARRWDIFPCGTVAAYCRGCRCTECRDAKALSR